MPACPRGAALAALLVACAAGRAAVPPDAFSPGWTSLTTDVDALLAAEGIVGGALWFMHDGAVLRRHAYGLADAASGRPVNDDTIFHWASITKTVTGVAIMQLRDRGALRLDDPVVKHVPEFASVHAANGSAADVTIRHVMTHATGMRAGTWPWGGEPWHPFEPTEWQQLVAMFPYTELAFAPGSRYSYSNPAIILLGRIIEVVSGEPYEAYVHKHVFMPLGMTRSYFDATPPYLLRHRSNSYTVRNGEPVANGLDFDTGITVSNSGLNAPLGDMSRYATFLMGEPGNRAFEAVLARDSLEEMFEPRLPMTDPVAELSRDTPQNIGLVFFVVDAPGGRIVGHTGSQQGFRAFLYVDPERRTAAIAAFNTDRAAGETRGPDAEQVLATVRQRVFEDLFPLFERSPGRG